MIRGSPEVLGDYLKRNERRIKVFVGLNSPVTGFLGPIKKFQAKGPTPHPDRKPTWGVDFTCVLNCDKSALGGTRTPNLLIRSQMLYPLSYKRITTATIPE